MKKITAIILSLAACWVMAACSGERPVELNGLPEQAQQFLETYFADAPVAYARQSKGQIDKEYKVVFIDGGKIEFSRRGQWKEIECRSGALPAGIVPQPIADYVASNYDAVSVNKIERLRRGFEVGLSNRLELKFDRDFRLTEIDD